MIAEAYAKAVKTAKVHGGWTFFPVFGDPAWQNLSVNDCRQILPAQTLERMGIRDGLSFPDKRQRRQNQEQILSIELIKHCSR